MQFWVSWWCWFALKCFYLLQSGQTVPGCLRCHQDTHTPVLASTHSGPNVRVGFWEPLSYVLYKGKIQSLEDCSQSQHQGQNYRLCMDQHLLKEKYLYSIHFLSLHFLLKSILFYPEQQDQTEQLWKHHISSQARYLSKSRFTEQKIKLNQKVGFLDNVISSKSRPEEFLKIE